MVGQAAVDEYILGRHSAQFKFGGSLFKCPGFGDLQEGPADAPHKSDKPGLFKFLRRGSLSKEPGVSQVSVATSTPSTVAPRQVSLGPRTIPGLDAILQTHWKGSTTNETEGVLACRDSHSHERQLNSCLLQGGPRNTYLQNDSRSTWMLFMS